MQPTTTQTWIVAELNRLQAEMDAQKYPQAETTTGLNNSMRFILEQQQAGAKLH